MAKKIEKKKDNMQDKVMEEAAKKSEKSGNVSELDNSDINEPEANLDQQKVEVNDAAAVNEALIRLEEEKEEFKNALVRERADFENYKKRNAELSATSYKNGIADAVSEILPVMDNFERALATECGDSAFLDGMKMIMRQLEGVLTEMGVEKIDTTCLFNPELHNAVLQVDEEGFESNAIVETMQNGYKLKEKILRHAMVKVNK